jgi:hypothetical protein
MTELEQRLRDELHRISERADAGSIRPLRDPRARGRSRLVRWLAPVAAVAAVIAVIAGVSLAGRSPRSPGTAAPDVMPPYYVIVQTGYTPGTVSPRTLATVRDSRTGAALTSVLLPILDPANVAVSAAADDRTFLIADGNDLFLLRLAADGRSAQLTRLANTLPTFGVPGAAALSPDGRTVAIENQSSCNTVSFFQRPDELGCRDNVIRLVSLATGTTRTWSTQASWQPVMLISWDGNDHLLFSWAAASKSGPQPSGYRLLNLAAPGSSLLAARTMPLPPLPVFGNPSVGMQAFVTPDGSAVIASMFKLVGDVEGRYTVIMSLDEFSAGTGRLVAVLREATMDDQKGPPSLSNDEGCSVLALGPGGVHALVECVDFPRMVFGRLDNGLFTPLPGMPDLNVAPNQGDAAW